MNLQLAMIQLDSIAMSNDTFGFHCNEQYVFERNCDIEFSTAAYQQLKNIYKRNIYIFCQIDEMRKNKNQKRYTRDRNQCRKKQQLTSRSSPTERREARIAIIKGKESKRKLLKEIITGEMSRISQSRWKCAGLELVLSPSHFPCGVKGRVGKRIKCHKTEKGERKDK